MTTSDQELPPRMRRGEQIVGKILQFADGHLLGWLLRQWWRCGATPHNCKASSMTTPHRLYATTANEPNSTGSAPSSAATTAEK